MPSEVVASGSPVPHEDLQTAGDYVVDINGVELVAPDVTSFRQLYDSLCALQWKEDGAQLVRIKNAFNRMGLCCWGPAW